MRISVVESSAACAAEPVALRQSPALSGWFEWFSRPAPAETEVAKAALALCGAALASGVLGARTGEPFTHAFFGPTSVLLAVLLVCPTYYVLGSQLGAVPSGVACMRALTRALGVFAVMGIGLAPASLMLVVSAETGSGARLFGWLALLMPGWMATLRLEREMRAALQEHARRAAVGRALLWGSLGLMALVVVRSWARSLPVLGLTELGS